MSILSDKVFTIIAYLPRYRGKDATIKPSPTLYTGEDAVMKDTLLTIRSIVL